MEELDLDTINFSGIKIEKIKIDPYLTRHLLRVDGANQDITEIYYWIYNYFAYYSGKGYITLKLEDHHHFSENSQFGANYRQMKGNTIRIFQENFQQLIQLVKVHMLPLLKEVKQADFYRRWLNQIVRNDQKVQEELKKPKNKQNKEKLKKYRGERNEAISHIKDKWVMEVDGGKIWQLQRSSTEQGLDFALLPQLFFGTSLDDPLQKNSTLKEQLDKTIYEVEISRDAKEQVGRFLYKFYTWLPTAIRETQTTFKIKIATLKQLYSNVQMTMNFIKPLLIEINRKKESLDFNNEWRGFELEHPDLVNMLDYSYFFIRNIGIRNFFHQDRDNYTISDLEFTRFGLFIKETYKNRKKKGSNEESKELGIFAGKFKGKSGFLNGQEGDYYIFYPSDKKNITTQEFNNLKKEKIHIYDLRKFPVMEITFKQRRRSELQQTQQGPQQVPIMKNDIVMMAKAWNIYEIASYRRKMKEKDFELLEGFVEEIKIVKEELLYYASDMENNYDPYDFTTSSKKSKEKDKKTKVQSEGKTLLIGPFQGMFEILSPLLPSFNKKTQNNSSISKLEEHPKAKKHLEIQLDSMEDTWKIYKVFKLTHRYVIF